MVLRSRFRERPEDNAIPIWTGALITDLKAKIIDVAESRFQVPSTLFTEDGRQFFLTGVGFAELRERNLRSAVRSYYERFKVAKPNLENALSHFWNTLDQEIPKLLTLVAELDPAPRDYKFHGGSDPWAIAVNRAAQAAYRANCPRLSNRQKMAYAAGLQNLYPKPQATKKSASQSTSENPKTSFAPHVL